MGLTEQLYYRVYVNYTRKQYQVLIFVFQVTRQQTAKSNRIATTKYLQCLSSLFLNVAHLVLVSLEDY